MNYDKDPLETILRIKWIGNEAIKIINDEGMEKIFEINASAGSEFKQLGYNQICNFEFLFTIDYQATKALTKKFFTDMSFSFITWKNIENLRDGELQIEDLDDESIKKICFTILPGGLTFLHVLYKKPKIVEKIF